MPLSSLSVFRAVSSPWQEHILPLAYLLALRDRQLTLPAGTSRICCSRLRERFISFNGDSYGAIKVGREPILKKLSHSSRFVLWLSSFPDP